MQPQPCPFCGSDKKKSKEHWLPKAWRDYFPLAPIMVTRRSVEGDRGETTVENRTPLDQQSSGICVACNSDWLRSLDVAAEARTINLALSTTALIPSNEILPIAMSYTRAALMKIWGDRTNFSYPEAAFRQFEARRLPPDGAHVFVGLGEEAFLYAGGHHSATNATDLPERGVHIIAWGLAWLVVIVVVPAGDNTSLANKVASQISRASKAFGRPLVKIWPRERGKPVHLARDRRISREELLFLTQATPLLAGTLPLIMEDEPARLKSRLNLSPDEIKKLIRFPTKGPPPLPEHPA